MKIAIIGAGVAGITTLRYASEAGHYCDCYEETDTYGGTWNYTHETGIDNDGQRIYRNMYRNLTTNLPNQLMQFADFPNSDSKNHFLKQSQVLEYLREYVNAYHLEQNIKFNQKVIKIEPQPQGKWLIHSKHVKSKIITSENYDFTFICSGRCRYPRFPDIIDQDRFKGLQMHSQNFRTPYMFENKRVLLIGASSSGLDIHKQIKDIAQTVFLSHWTTISSKIQNLVCCKPGVARLQDNTVIFTDGSTEKIDVIIYCTGYKYKFPFLSKTCGITTYDNWVTPLYKEVVNVEQPTMFFIGIPLMSAAFLVSDIQVRFAMAIIDKKINLPSKSAMLTDLNASLENLQNDGVAQRHFHKLGFRQRQYFAELEKTASLKPFPIGYSNLYDYLLKNITKILVCERRSSLLGTEMDIEN